MVKTITKTVRMMPDLWSEIEAFAKWSNPNAAICALARAGLRHLLGQKPLEARVRVADVLTPRISPLTPAQEAQLDRIIASKPSHATRPPPGIIGYASDGTPIKRTIAPRLKAKK